MKILKQTPIEDPILHYNLLKAMRLRESYMKESFQSFPEMAKRVLNSSHKTDYRHEFGILLNLNDFVIDLLIK